MYQTDQSTAATSLPAPAAAGAQGFFTNGNPAAGTPATILDADFMNMVMLELCNIVTAAGMTLSKTTYNQVLLAMKRLVQNQIVLTDTGAVNAYAAANTPPLLSATWVNGVTQQIVIAHTNTGASTYAPDGLTAIPIYGLGLQPLQGGELFAGGTAIMMKQTIAGVNSGSPIVILLECSGGAQQVAAATASLHAVQAGQLNNGTLKGIQKFTSSGTFTAPVTGTYYFSGCAAGAGGGGGGGTVGSTGFVGGGGGSGGGAGQSIVRNSFSLTAGQTVTITIGAAGSGGSAGQGTGTSGGNGVSGGNTVIGTLITLTGGSAGGGGGGQTSTSAGLPSGGAGAAGGTGFPGGQAGGDGNYAGLGGVGASGPFGGGGGGGRASTATLSVQGGYPSSGFGSGGGGGGASYGNNGAQAAGTGGAGSPGIAIVEW